MHRWRPGHCDDCGEFAEIALSVLPSALSPETALYDPIKPLKHRVTEETEVRILIPVPLLTPCLRVSKVLPSVRQCFMAECWMLIAECLATSFQTDGYDHQKSRCTRLRAHGLRH